MRTFRFTTTPFCVPEGGGVVVERLGCLVTSMLTVHADQFPSALTDEEIEVISHHRAVHQTVSRAVGLDGAGIVVGESCGVFLPLAIINTIINCITSPVEKMID